MYHKIILKTKKLDTCVSDWDVFKGIPKTNSFMRKMVNTNKDYYFD